jgi:hypothetical protein
MGENKRADQPTSLGRLRLLACTSEMEFSQQKLGVNGGIEL